MEDELSQQENPGRVRKIEKSSAAAAAFGLHRTGKAEEDAGSLYPGGKRKETRR